MKHLILVAALIAATFSTAFAGGRLTMAENDAAMKTGRAELTAKTTELETKVKNHDEAGAKSAATEVLTLMHKGMVQTSAKINLGPAEQKAEGAKHYNALEKTAHEYSFLSDNVTANSKALIEHARSFIKEY